MSQTVRPQIPPAAPSAPRDWPSDFKDRLTCPLPDFREALSVLWHGGFHGDTREAALIPVRRDRLVRPGPAQTAITWAGHASYVLQIGGLTVLTDPVWSHRIPGVRRRLTPPGVAWADLPPVDAVVISHNHYDHLDWPTVRRLPRDTAILCPARLGPWFTKRGFTRVYELDWWESVTLGGVEFDFVPAHHWSRRTLWDTCKTLWGGWVLTAERHRIYFAGDTAYGERFQQIGDRYPGIDLALMPVGAYEPRWFMHASHVDPAQAVKACRDLGVRRMATMHWGTFVLSAEPVLAPLREVREAWAAARRDPADLWDMAVGETRLLAG